EHALERLQPKLGFTAGAWTATAPLPGGDIENGDFGAFLDKLRRNRPWLPPDLAWRLARNYGTCVEHIVGQARCIEDLGQCLGADLFESEAQYLMDYEWACTAEDILWRRSKLGLRFNKVERANLEA